MARRFLLRYVPGTCIKCIVLLCILCTFVYIYATRNAYSNYLDSIQNLRRDILQPPFGDADDKKHDVILSAYMNSGSRYTGQLLGFLDDSFFFYEPLWRFSLWDYFRPPNMQCSSTIGTCRSVKTEDVNTFRPDPRTNAPEKILDAIPRNIQPVELMLYVLSSILRCELVPLLNLIQERVHDLPIYAGPSWGAYRVCLSNFVRKSKCLAELEKVCKEKSHRIVKVLRLSVGSFRPLLETNSRLKIVHLIRDPRAIVHSRLYSRFYPAVNHHGNDSLERNLCEKMLEDIVEVKRLRRDYPGRVEVVYYEDLMHNHHERLKQLYKFLNMTYNDTVVKDLTQVKTNLAPPEKGDKFVMDRKVNNTVWWRKYMPLEHVKHIDDVCYNVYRELGYKTMSEYAVRDFKQSNLEILDSLSPS